MATFRYDYWLAVDATGNPQENATYTFVDSAGTTYPTTDLTGSTNTLSSGPSGIGPQFITTVSRGYLKAADGSLQTIVSVIDVDALTVTVAGYSTAASSSASVAQTAAASASGAVSSVSTGLTALQGTVAAVRTDLTALQATVAALPAAGGAPFPGGQTDATVRTTSNSFPTNPRGTGSANFHVIFIGNATALGTLTLAPAGSAAGPQEGDELKQVG